jgi:uncharacterized membrane protein
MKIVVLVALVSVYAGVSLWLMLHATNQPWAVAAIFGPLVAGFVGVAWKRRHWLHLGAGVAAAAGLLAVTLLGGVDDVQRLYLLQHVGVHLMLAWLFGHTLRTGGKPLITALAEPLHREFPPAMQAYTRRLTALWAAYCAGMAVVSVLLYAFAPWSWWTLFANVLTPLAHGALFVGEIPVRYWLHPEFERSSFKAMVSAWQRHHGASEGGR